jgi:hypothetical protein
MKLEKFNELNKTMSKFFDACEFHVFLNKNNSETILRVVDTTKDNLVLVEMTFENRMSTNTKKNVDVLEFDLYYLSSRSSDKLTDAELSAVKSIIKMYKNA